MRFSLFGLIIAYLTSVVGLFVLKRLSKRFLRSKNGLLFKFSFLIFAMRMLFPFHIVPGLFLPPQIFNSPIGSAVSYLGQYNVPMSIHDNSRVTSGIPLQLILITSAAIIWVCMAAWRVYGDIKVYGCFIWSFRKAKHTIDEQVNRVAARAKAITSIKTNVRIIYDEAISLPTYSGLLRPTIYLPKVQRTDDALFSVLHHEYTHIAHKDAWWKMLYMFMKDFMFINPMLHRTFEEFDQSCEHHCDASISKTYSSKRQYISYFSAIQNALVAHEDIIRQNPFSVALTGNTNDAGKRKNVALFRMQTMNADANKVKHGRHAVILLLLATLTFSSVAFTPYNTNLGLSYGEEGINTGYIVEGREGIVCLLDCKDGIYHLYVDGAFMMPIEFEDGKADEGFVVFDTIEEIQSYVMEVKYAMD